MEGDFSAPCGKTDLGEEIPMTKSQPRTGHTRGKGPGKNKAAARGAAEQEIPIPIQYEYLCGICIRACAGPYLGSKYTTIIQHVSDAWTMVLRASVSVWFSGFQRERRPAV